MGSGQSSAKPAETQDADTGTQLFGSWDKPVAEAYALKKQASKKGKAAASTAADAATAALGSAINLEAGAGVKPAGKTSHAKYKGAGVPGYSPAVHPHKYSLPVPFRCCHVLWLSQI